MKMSCKSRSSSYTNEEDMLLCHVYLDVSQDPIKGSILESYRDKLQRFQAISHPRT
ncbi:uncharacterized protein [Primulina eburnea]|uniref:uncharacterized protein n=1 Tax=Primulina eburnea TaxID=1245227 RepID=UPI003C6CC24E